MKLISALLLATAIATTSARAQAPAPPNAPAVDACRASGLIALKENSPSVKALAFDMDTLLISKANTQVEDVPVRTVMMGDAYLEKKGVGKPQRFVCLIGEKGKVLLTFFMAQ
ncbi:MAG TPA: hypothetical protein VHY35_05300 [Stellaceae bacterium]|jgi:hypothetical protein|nr:hypothetical protein [Stellaceae bacterium]